MNTITRLAIGSVKENKSRSILIGISIFLTTVLLTMIGTCGYGIIKSNLQNAEVLYGEYYATYSGVTEKQLEAMKIHAQFVNVGKTSMVASIDNDKADMYLSFMDDIAVQLSHSSLVEGYYPKEKYEIAATRDMFTLMGLQDPKIGGYVTIPYRINGEGKILSKEFIISGIVPTDETNEIKKAYQAYVSEDFVEDQIPADRRSYTVCFQVMNEEKLNYDQMKEKIDQLAENIGISSNHIKLNTAYLMWKLDPGYETIFTCAGIGLCIILFSILVIYNIFHVGMLQKVREYGKVRALGATKKQMKGLVLREGLLLSAFSIPLGLLAGLLSSKVLFIMIGNNNFVKRLGSKEILNVTLFNIPILAGVALVSLLTVYLSLRKPMKLAATISPVEAIRFQGYGKKKSGLRKGRREMNVLSLTLSDLSMNRKRTITTILTMGLSAVLFVVAANVAGNMDAEYDARQSVEKGQFLIKIDAAANDVTYPENNLNQVQKQNIFSQEFMESIRNTEGVTKVETRKVLHARVINEEVAEDEKYCFIEVLGKDDFERIVRNCKRGDADYQTAAKQNGVIFMWDNFLDFYGYHIGQELQYSILDGDQEVPFNAILQGSAIHGDSSFVMTEDTFEKLDLQNDMTTQVFVYCKKGMEEEVQSNLENMISGREHLEMTSYQDALKLSEFSMSLLKSALYALLAVVGVIGFMNMANTMITSILTRRRELGILQAIGMTERQVNSMLQLEGLIFTIGTLFVALSIGNILGYQAFVKCKEKGIVGINLYHIPIAELGIMIGAILVLQVVLSYALSRNLQKDTLIDRIRYEE
jgi:putative ABC transport system permease protein